MANSELWSSPVVQTLFARSPPAPLTAKNIWHQDLTAQINQLPAGPNVKAVLHLLNDNFNGCHEITQTQEGNPYADHMHSIAHRREPDYENSKYWIGRFSHEHLPDIYSPGGTVTQAKQEMDKFVDAVQSVEASGTGVADNEKRQWEEMTKLARILIDSEREL
ncbi:hypothetical protein DEU56DRAFT_873025 [Suillus clintonianus]|uniref:uncharacterized protein n=1 Tax=Suillus clintonianus TaxID=1904413 RepID=UPI001B8760AF|nr:uncharacterized protein DEU56DRAFT_873025 [Suillus clintonianus]KAG2125716.1 hypothetical protein DEU56DRAFT_873025 [Suillus clintonianus]